MRIILISILFAGCSVNFEFGFGDKHKAYKDCGRHEEHYNHEKHFNNKKHEGHFKHNEYDIHNRSKQYCEKYEYDGEFKEMLIELGDYEHPWCICMADCNEMPNYCDEKFEKEVIEEER